MEEQQRELEQQRNVMSQQQLQQRRSVTLHTPSPSSLQYPVSAASHNGAPAISQQRQQPSHTITEPTTSPGSGPASNTAALYDNVTRGSVSEPTSAPSGFVSGGGCGAAPPNVNLYSVGHILQCMNSSSTSYERTTSNSNNHVTNSNHTMWNLADSGFPSLQHL